MTTTDQILASFAQALARNGTPFVIATYDAVTGKAKLAASPTGLAQLAPFLAKQIKPHLPDDVPEVGWNDQG